MSEETKPQVKEGLFDLLFDEIEIMREIELNGGEISDTLFEDLKQVTPKLQKKIDSYAFLIDRLECEANFAKEKAKRFQTLSKNMDNLRDRIKSRMKDSMRTFDKKEVQGFEWKFLRAALEPSIHLKEGVDPKDLPEEIRKEKITYSLDKTKAKELIKEGKTFDKFIEARPSDALRMKPVLKRIR